jgi:outer membrane protein TolC
MSRRCRPGWAIVVFVSGIGLDFMGGALHTLHAQEPAPVLARPQTAPAGPAVSFPAPAPGPDDKPLPINLPTALKLANARPIDIGLASERIRAAMAQLQQAKVLWLPTIYLGLDYFRYDGQNPTAEGPLETVSKSTFMVGGGPVAVFALTDAIFSPLAARQVVRAQEAGLQAATNDTMLAVAEAYFNVQQARGEFASAEDAARRAQELVRRSAELSNEF